MTIADLSKQLPNENELRNYAELIMKESDRGAAIMAAAYVETALWTAICTRIPQLDEKTLKSWFDGPLAPFGSFAAKITLGRALCIYGEHMEKRLILIKNIRNAFAHAPRPLDFSHPTLIEECIQLTPDPMRDAITPRRQIFSASCLALAKVLIVDAVKHGGKEVEVSFP